MKVNAQIKKREGNGGFTLIEILVVIGIIAVLAAVVLIAINPARQFAQANNSQRTANANAILNAVGQYMADNQGDISDLDVPDGEIDEDFCDNIVPTYMPAMPTDPLAGGEGASFDDCADIDPGVAGYEVTEDANGRVTVCAPDTQDLGDEVIEVICITR